jgi:hypothetical protein
MTNLTSPDGWAPSRQTAPSVRIVADPPGLPGAQFGGPDSRRRRRAGSDSRPGSIMMSLLVVSTTLALYDLYVLLSTLATG